MATPQIHRATPSLKALVIERDMCGSWATPVPGANLVALQNAGLLIFDAETVLRPVRLLAEEAKKPHIARQRKVPDRAESGGRVESELWVFISGEVTKEKTRAVTGDNHPSFDQKPLNFNSTSQNTGTWSDNLWSSGVKCPDFNKASTPGIEECPKRRATSA
ncbi:hypothetical protein B0H14DRAFT_3151922 [Mycena olivaceomarginata]|nr:hypothetical protein B0H14DRAFT_3151922 [Mycena olivaceomarginata]